MSIPIKLSMTIRENLYPKLLSKGLSHLESIKLCEKAQLNMKNDSKYYTKNPVLLEIFGGYLLINHNGINYK